MYDRKVMISPGMNVQRALSCLDSYIAEYRDDGRGEGARHGVPYVYTKPEIDAYYVYHTKTTYVVRR